MNQITTRNKTPSENNIFTLPSFFFNVNVTSMLLISSLKFSHTNIDARSLLNWNKSVHQGSFKRTNN